ncbi:unnamed protein product [Darwinula stevensoni]|uniref:Oplophorus-luciferin 2-monooxygenase non-catalytic subunit n=1 Tax=Darwinula stevensoni TaxID=69355 RepID=A0A7R9AEB2_9CRUS|nr:unnamed protein product [Darwinula stevensoni]CAG0901740.1 unnamed protein product [Darwinula stevensoni]
MGRVDLKRSVEAIQSTPDLPPTYFTIPLTFKMQGLFVLLSLSILLFSASRTRGQSPCPDPEDILPCTCYHNGNIVNVACLDATSSEQIFSVFNDVNWLFKKLTEFWIMSTEGVRELPEGVFGDVMFQSISVSQNDFVSIHPSVLLSSKDRIQDLFFFETLLEEFPWDTFPQLTNLTEVDVIHNALTTLPSLQSASLGFLSVRSNQIHVIEAAPSLPNLRQLHLDDNPISELPTGFFNDMGKLEEFWCQYCSFGPTLPTGSFQFHSERISHVDLWGNSISTLELDAIAGIQSNTRIVLRENVITELTEASFRPIVEILSQGDGEMDVYGNPVECGCSIAWLILNPDFLGRVIGACADGTNFQDLDPNIFQDFCIKSDPPMPGDYTIWINSD